MNIFICIGVLVYVVMSLINRFVKKIPDGTYIPLAIFGISLIIIGFIQG